MTLNDVFYGPEKVQNIFAKERKKKKKEDSATCCFYIANFGELESFWIKNKKAIRTILSKSMTWVGLFSKIQIDTGNYVKTEILELVKISIKLLSAQMKHLNFSLRLSKLTDCEKESEWKSTNHSAWTDI